MLASLLLAWYDTHRRVLPFRGTKDPYRVWISEIMLQQTRTETVGAYYERFLLSFPDVFTLADASEQDVLKCWEGLGYYSRARNLHKAAKAVVSAYGGVFPADVEKLRALPGVGDYTAAAVGSIAFGLPAPAMDGNLTRVLSRVHGVREDVGAPSVKRRLADLAQADMPPVRCGDFNQALMDLGATVCVPGTPECESCPLRPLCDAYKAGDADALPVKTAAKPPAEIPVSVALITCGGKIYLRQRKETLLGGLWVYQLTERAKDVFDIEKAQKALGIRAHPVKALGPARHVFTHRVWNMTVYHYEAEDTACREGRFFTLREMEKLPIPTAMRAARAFAQELLTPAVLPLREETLLPIARAYAESWQDSHRAHCTEAFWRAHTPESMADRLRGHLAAGRQAYGLYLAGQAAGALVIDPRENELNVLYVRPEAQGAGVGRAATAFAVSHLDRTRDMRVTLLETNARARSLYQKFGFLERESLRVLDEKNGLCEETLIRRADFEEEES
ncbi:MAG: A/G-specific adenine glycosylase [Clostridia bacterium]|nr:A/G-specific adenine glycosylase [Clostridia bacterium]